MRLQEILAAARRPQAARGGLPSNLLKQFGYGNMVVAVALSQKVGGKHRGVARLSSVLAPPLPLPRLRLLS